MALSAGEITALAGSIVGEFINKLPQIVTGVKNIQNQQSGGGNGRRNGIDDLSNDFERVIVNRMKRERDVNDKLYELIKERAKELKTLKSYNEELKQIVSQTGTYNNMSQLIVKTLTDKIHNTANTQDKTIGGIQKVRVSLDGIVNDFSNLMNTIEKGNRTTLGSLTDFVKTDFSKSLADLAKEVADNSALGSSADASALRKLAENLKTSTTLGPQTDSRNLGAQLIKHLGPILAGINANIQQFDTMNNELFKQSKINKITASELNQNLELMADYQSTLGDISGELKGLDEIKNLQSRLNVLTQDYNKTENKTADVISVFNKQQKDLFDLMAPLVETNIKVLKDEAKKQAREQDKQKLINAIREGFQTGPGSDSFKKQIEDKVGMLGNLSQFTPITNILGKSARLLSGQIIPAIKEVATDQREVMKYGVTMSDNGIFGNTITSNIANAAKMGMSGSQLAQILGENRVMGSSMGGQGNMTSFMTKILGGTAGGELFKYANFKDGKHFSELVGGDEQHKSDTMLSMMRALQSSGITASIGNFQKQIDDKGGIFDAAYQTGQLQKDYANFLGSMTESSTYSSDLLKMDEAQLDQQTKLIGNIQILGAKLGLSTIATQTMTKQLYENTRGVGASDRLSAAPIASVLENILGGTGGKLSQLVGLNGDDQVKFMKDNLQSFLPFIQAYVSSQNDTTANGMQGEIIQRILAQNPYLQKVITQLEPLIQAELNQSKLAKGGLDKGLANNANINPGVATLVTEYDKFNAALQAGPLHMAEYLASATGVFKDWLSEKLPNIPSMTVFADAVEIRNNDKESNSDMVSAIFDTATVDRVQDNLDKLLYNHMAVGGTYGNSYTLPNDNWQSNLPLQMATGDQVYGTEQQFTKHIENILNDSSARLQKSANEGERKQLINAVKEAVMLATKEKVTIEAARNTPGLLAPEISNKLVLVLDALTAQIAWANNLVSKTPVSVSVAGKGTVLKNQ